MRLTVVLGHGGDPDFTWAYVSLGAYSVFEPLGGILSTNLPIIWHMWRKRGPLLPGSSAFRSAKSSTTTPASGGSRSSRLARSLGFAQTDQTADSQSRTVAGNEDETGNGLKDSSVVVARSGDAQVWERVERVHSNVLDEGGEASSEGGAGNDEPTNSQEFGGKNSTAKRDMGAQGMRKNVWEVRKK